MTSHVNMKQYYHTFFSESCRFLEAEDKFNALTASCQLQLDDEEAQLEAKSKSNKEQLEGHKVFDCLVIFCALQTSYI